MNVAVSSPEPMFIEPIVVPQRGPLSAAGSPAALAETHARHMPQASPTRVYFT